jgi:hypothetical protein
VGAPRRAGEGASSAIVHRAQHVLQLAPAAGRQALAASAATAHAPPNKPAAAVLRLLRRHRSPMAVRVQKIVENTP